MVYKALTSFSGVISMAMGESRELPDSPIVTELLKVGYLQEVKPKAQKVQEAEKPEEEKPKKRRKKNEN